MKIKNLRFKIDLMIINMKFLKTIDGMDFEKHSNTIKNKQNYQNTEKNSVD